MSEHCRYSKENIRIVSLVPSSRGTGVVVLESPPIFLLCRTVLPARSNLEERVTELDELLTWYRPDVLLLEDIHSRHCQRGERYRQIVQQLTDQAGRYGIAVRPVAREEVFVHFDLPASASKVTLAREVAERVPILKQLVPPERRLWDTQPHWIPMFDAMAHILTAFRAE